MRITKVYTRTGDAGRTRLAGGQQVWEDRICGMSIGRRSSVVAENMRAGRDDVY